MCLFSNTASIARAAFSKQAKLNRNARISLFDALTVNVAVFSQSPPFDFH